MISFANAHRFDCTMKVLLSKKFRTVARCLFKLSCCSKNLWRKNKAVFMVLIGCVVQNRIFDVQYAPIWSDKAFCRKIHRLLFTVRT